ncbi:recombination protein RecR [Caproiciproducens sp. NJN-50]|uniref:recombination mediator RecR n=1 Tax=Acutalibacteraceae TaxID=3082771 RepID=UPI000FFE0D78|nr:MULTISPECIES: recombination mediator RecR [Acutalibacteraceae]QAT49241.1 recombination protein RecR [Caproiciproducens sp. NJN-50]
MAGYHIPPLSRLIDQFERLPGIGGKSAQRLAYYVLGLSEDGVKELSDAILDAHKKIHYCKVCCNLTDEELCPICRNPARDHSVICVVEDPRDVIALERTHEFNAVYHVLHGVISPLNGIGPDQLCIKELLARIGNKDQKIAEVIMATNPTVEGEATAMYLSRLLKPLGVKVTRLAYGIPVGGELEYADEFTLTRALEGRSEI